VIIAPLLDRPPTLAEIAWLRDVLAAVAPRDARVAYLTDLLTYRERLEADAAELAQMEANLEASQRLRGKEVEQAAADVRSALQRAGEAMVSEQQRRVDALRVDVQALGNGIIARWNTQLTDLKRNGRAALEALNTGDAGQ
jgi:hypothetical protein